MIEDLRYLREYVIEKVIKKNLEKENFVEDIGIVVEDIVIYIFFVILVMWYWVSNLVRIYIVFLYSNFIC